MLLYLSIGEDIVRVKTIFTISANVSKRAISIFKSNIFLLEINKCINFKKYFDPTFRSKIVTVRQFLDSKIIFCDNESFTVLDRNQTPGNVLKKIKNFASKFGKVFKLILILKF